jgi:hypothetical protein
MRKFAFILLGTLFLLTSAAAPIFALTLDFDGITNNKTADVAIGEAQLQMYVYELNAQQVAFEFRNLGPAQSTITSIYFDDNLKPNLITPLSDPFYADGTSAGVSFKEGATPVVLPGGLNPVYSFTADYAYDATNPAPEFGINPYEILTILFGYAQGKGFDDIYNALFGDLRVGLHVTNFASGGSESFINTPIPEPGTMLLLGLGLLGLVGMRKKLMKK